MLSESSVILLFCAVIFSGFSLYMVSALEVAVFSIEKTDKENFSGSRRWLLKMLDQAGDLAAFFILARGLTLGCLALSHHLYFSAISLDGGVSSYLLEVIMFGIISIFAMSVLPATAVSWEDKSIMSFAPFLRTIYIILYPIKQISKVILDFIFKHSGLEGVQSIAIQRKLAYITDEGGADIEDEERQMIRQIVSFVETTVREVMIPRIDIICAPVSSSLEEIVSLIRKHGHSRIPLYKGGIDNIIGILYAKDLLLSMTNPAGEIDLLKICRKPYFVPEAKLISELLEEFRREKIHMAVVVDEYGGVAGLVTMEDLLEEIVGEIQDEYDIEEAPVEQISHNTWRVTGRTLIDDVSDIVGEELPSEHADTIGGLVYQLTGSIPQPGSQIKLDNGILIIVEEVEQQRIKKVRIVKSDE